jgi:hypothetical protein
MPNSSRSLPTSARPHEHEHGEEAVTRRPDPVIEQAARDIDAGLVDTDLRATAGLDAARRRKLVRGAASMPPAERDATKASARRQCAAGK